jgi:hypothetical protein
MKLLLFINLFTHLIQNKIITQQNNPMKFLSIAAISTLFAMTQSLLIKPEQNHIKSTSNKQSH